MGASLDQEPTRIVRPPSARVEELFDALVDLDPAEAERRLDAECAGDGPLRAAVEELLRHDRAAPRGFLAPRPELLVEAVREKRSSDPAPPARAEAGSELPAGSSRLGRFYVLHKLGEGGMGLVYVGY